ncbi:MAG: low specificity L-threonine aldolase [Pseudomonadota bacterium]|nr:low specificity L-threonine aldolase [Pseudomonadota bacterium]
MAAVQAANVESVPSYGGDPSTEALQSVASEVFERQVAIFPVTTGTAANALALSQFVPPYASVYCHEHAHIITDECAAPEFFTGGSKLIGFPATNGKITSQQVIDAVATALDMGVHHVKPGAISLSQATEWGTVYQPEEVSTLAIAAKGYGLAVHMDGARFANALVCLGCSPAEATWKCGIDVLSLGATKNGAMCAEAVVFFDPAQARDFDRRRKRSGHLWSKLRFLSAQLLAYFEDDLWLKNARHANDMASALAAGLGKVAGARLLQSVDANEIFVALPERTIIALESQGFEFYRWPCDMADGVAIRLVTSFATPRLAVDALIDAAQRCD